MCLTHVFMQKDLKSKHWFKSNVKMEHFYGQKFFSKLVDYTNNHFEKDPIIELFNSQKKFFGYKVLDKNLSCVYLKKCKLKKWMTAQRNIEQTSRGDFYVTGFHILWDLDGAREFSALDSDYAIYRVEYEGPHALGIDNSCEVVLARKMRILNKVRK